MCTDDVFHGIAVDGALQTSERKIAEAQHISLFFDGRSVSKNYLINPCGFVGWGRKRSGLIAQRCAHKKEKPYFLIEDGFIRSVGLGLHGAPTVSMVIDNEGIYYDATQPSRLDRLISYISMGHSSSNTLLHEAISLFCTSEVSKYNLGKLHVDDSIIQNKIIIVDQTVGDESVSGSLSNQDTFRYMLKRALAHHNTSDILICSHPDVKAGLKKGYLTKIARQYGLLFVDDCISPIALLKQAREIWTVSSGLGYEALLHGVKVRSFGASFYTGYGLTIDHLSELQMNAIAKRRPLPNGICDLFDAFSIRYTRYVDPLTSRTTDFSGAIHRLVDWRNRSVSIDRPIKLIGFSLWKHRAMRAFCPTANFERKANDIGSREPAACWASKASVRQNRTEITFNVEDGIIRSKGLGSNLIPPTSLIFDDVGIYYDASRPSRLEKILEAGAFQSTELEAAKIILNLVRKYDLTKYNLPSHSTPSRFSDRRTILVVEQVPGDASLRLGGNPNIAGNAEFLALVRQLFPDCFLLYKEHPDLVSGNRLGRLNAKALHNADLVISSGDTGQLYRAVDSVATISSTAGFEALLRGIPVHVWGMPFYAGWGLTVDQLRCFRRIRRITLIELVAGALVVYPKYIDPKSYIPCDALTYIQKLALENSSTDVIGIKESRIWRFISSLKYIIQR
jgi:capsular polysaccharide export protein